MAKASLLKRLMDWGKEPMADPTKDDNASADEPKNMPGQAPEDSAGNDGDTDDVAEEGSREPKDPIKGVSQESKDSDDSENGDEVDGDKKPEPLKTELSLLEDLDADPQPLLVAESDSSPDDKEKKMVEVFGVQVEEGEDRQDGEGCQYFTFSEFQKLAHAAAKDGGQAKACRCAALVNQNGEITTVLSATSKDVQLFLRKVAEDRKTNGISLPNWQPIAHFGDIGPMVGAIPQPKDEGEDRYAAKTPEQRVQDALGTMNTLWRKLGGIKGEAKDYVDWVKEFESNPPSDPAAVAKFDERRQEKFLDLVTKLEELQRQASVDLPIIRDAVEYLDRSSLGLSKKKQRKLKRSVEKYLEFCELNDLIKEYLPFVYDKQDEADNPVAGETSDANKGETAEAANTDKDDSANESGEATSAPDQNLDSNSTDSTGTPVQADQPNSESSEDAPPVEPVPEQPSSKPNTDTKTPSAEPDPVPPSSSEGTPASADEMAAIFGNAFAQALEKTGFSTTNVTKTVEDAVSRGLEAPKAQLDKLLEGQEQAEANTAKAVKAALAKDTSAKNLTPESLEAIRALVADTVREEVDKVLNGIDELAIQQGKYFDISTPVDQRIEQTLDRIGPENLALLGKLPRESIDALLQVLQENAEGLL